MSAKHQSLEASLGPECLLAILSTSASCFNLKQGQPIWNGEVAGAVFWIRASKILLQRLLRPKLTLCIIGYGITPGMYFFIRLILEIISMLQTARQCNSSTAYYGPTLLCWR